MIDVIFSIAISAEGSGRIEHALADQAPERFRNGIHSKIAHGLGEEASIEKVHHSVFDATDVEVDSAVHPVIRSGFVEGGGVVAGICEAHEIPG